MSASTYQLFATAPRGMESLLARELTTFAADGVAVGAAGVAFRGSLEVAYRACLWSRTANRILLNIGEFPATDEQALYAAIRSLDWSRHLAVDGTLAVNAHCAKSRLTHSQFVAQRIKDAVVDQFREHAGRRPDVDRDKPDVRINAYLHRNRLRLSLDLSGSSLHRRGYRAGGGGAPLKENLAAALLLLSDWPGGVARKGSLFDPMCGSGTLLIEAAMIAADIAPGLLRKHWGFAGWRQHQPRIWEALVEDAVRRRDAGLLTALDIRGSDIDQRALGIARANIEAAGLQNIVRLATADISKPIGSDTANVGLLITNPPYGVRMGDGDLAKLYTSLGRLIRQHSGWCAAVFSGNPELCHRFRLRSSASTMLKNGDLDCKLIRFEVPQNTCAGTHLSKGLPESHSINTNREAEMFANRLKKNMRSLNGWIKSAGVECFRVYDADLPEYAAAIDLFHCRDGELRVHLQEYLPPKTVPAERAQQRLHAMRSETARILECGEQNVFVKVRQRQRGNEQYEKLARRGELHTVQEGNCQVLVNFHDYHDCGLFLDHRKVRQKIGNLSQGKRFLNLFAYTGCASVSAALGGARQVTTVDLSNNYLDWAQKNFALNKLTGDQYSFVRADCLEWLGNADGAQQYDLVLLDPPTFSNSKRMEQSWDVQRDHAELIEKAMLLLARDGLLLFSCNRRQFKLDLGVASRFDCREITRQTVPRDFSRNRHVHRCWEIRALHAG